MKICHMTSAHDSLDDRIFLKECVSTAKAGYNTYLVAQGESFQKNDVQVIGIGEQNRTRLRRMLFTSRDIYTSAVALDADVYQFHDPELLPYGLKLKKSGKRVIYDSHEDVPRQIMAKEWLPLFMRKAISCIFERYEKYVSKKLDCVIAATVHIEQIFKVKGIKAITVKNYPILGDISGCNDDYFLRNNQVCYAGGLTRQRGITEMVQAVQFCDGKLCLAGDMDDDYKRELEQKNSWSKVDMLGYINREELNEMYNQSRIGMAVLKRTPNHVNALAIKLFEYMAAGIPIICSDFPLWIKIVSDNKCGICVPPESVEKIAEAIKYLLDNPEIAKSMGDEGKKVVREKYNWENEEEVYLNYLKTLKA